MILEPGAAGERQRLVLAAFGGEGTSERDASGRADRLAAMEEGADGFRAAPVSDQSRFCASTERRRTGIIREGVEEFGDALEAHDIGQAAQRHPFQHAAHRLVVDAAGDGVALLELAGTIGCDHLLQRFEIDLLFRPGDLGRRHGRGRGLGLWGERSGHADIDARISGIDVRVDTRQTLFLQRMRAIRAR